jgi:hypothetical protein
MQNVCFVLDRALSRPDAFSSFDFSMTFITSDAIAVSLVYSRFLNIFCLSRLQVLAAALGCQQQQQQQMQKQKQPLALLCCSYPHIRSNCVSILKRQHPFSCKCLDSIIDAVFFDPLFPFVPSPSF